MKTQLCTIAGGNPSIFVWDCPPANRNIISARYLRDAEQVGFVAEDDASARLTMMGGELCINGTIAIASLISPGKQLYASGISNEIAFSTTNAITSIEITLPYKRTGNFVLFDKIGYEITDEMISKSLDELSLLAQRFKLPAMGQICFQNDRIYPYVYVRQTNSLVAESACGSGSIAFSIATGISNIQQPTGQYISVERIRETQFKISTNVFSKGGDNYDN